MFIYKFANVCSGVVNRTTNGSPRHVLFMDFWEYVESSFFGVLNVEVVKSYFQ